MRRSLFLPFVLLASSSIAQTQKDLDLTAPDGTKLRATFYAAAKPGPGVLLLHMCNTTRKSWEPVAKELSQSGINALTIDNRGFGESGDVRYEGGSPEALQKLEQKWPADFDVAWQYLASQPSVDKNRLAAGGGSCGVNNAVKLAERHPDIKALVLLAGSTDPDGINFLLDHRGIPLFTAAAADDQYMSTAPQLMKWFSDLTGNPRNQFVGFANGRHGTEIFGPHPELVHKIVAFYVDTLVTSPVSASPPPPLRDTPEQKFWLLASKPGGATDAVAMFHEARQRDPSAYLFPETLVNLLGYTRLQAGAKDEAIQLFKLNTEAYPASANTQDSLSDGYLAAGQKELALAAEEKCLALLPADPSDPQFKADLRKHAEERVADLRSNKKNE
jgi:dienelactone hydrolase